MRKWISIICPFVMIFILTSFRFGINTDEVKVPDTLKVNKPTKVLFPQNKTIDEMIVVNPPFLGNTYVGFKEALAFKESQGDYFITNTLGYLGKYQFGVGTLQLMGVYNAVNFLSNPELQEKVFQINIARNKWILRRDIKRFVGVRVNGVVVTESGILAAAHLAGAGNVKKYLRSYGEKDFTDAYGSNIAYYVRKFSGYDVSLVSAERNPKI